MKSIRLSGLVAALLALGVMGIEARDYPSDANFIENQSMPKLKAGEYGTDVDNEDNDLTGNPDGDMDTYLGNDSSIHPIEFNIIINKTVSKSQAGVLKMNVYDIDSPDEVDDVYINGHRLGSLIGKNNEWGINRFTIPPGILKRGKNLVQIYVDQKNEGWMTSIDYGIISGLTAAGNGITRCWVAPTKVKAGEYVNFFAEISGKPKSVQLYNGDIRLPVKLTDPDGDSVYAAQYKIPKYMGGKNKGLKDSFRIRAEGSWGVSWCPGVEVTK